jgi:hypothetical protein
MILCVMHDTLAGITTDNDYSGLAAQYLVSECQDPMEWAYLPHDRHVFILHITFAWIHMHASL